MKKIIFCIWTICFGLILTACSSEPPEEMLPTATKEPTSTPIPPTQTPTPRPTAKMPPESTIIDLEPEFISSESMHVTHLTSTRSVTDISFDLEGDMWVATDGGIVQWNLSDNSSTKFTAEDGLLENFVTALAAAPDGSIWAETYNSLYYYDGNSWNSWLGDNLQNTESDGDIVFEDNFHIIGLDSDRNLWINNGLMLFYFDGSQWTLINSETDNSPRGIYNGKIGSDGTIWSSNLSDLWSFNGKTWKKYSIGEEFAGSWIQSFDVSTGSSVWAATDEGLFLFDGSSWEEVPLPGQDQGGYFYYLLALESGILLASYDSYENLENSGIYAFDGENWDKFNLPDEFSNLLATCMRVTSDGTIFFGTNAGVFRLNGDIWQRYFIEDEPAGNQIQTVYQDQAGNLWFATQQGISRYDGSEWFSFTPSYEYGQYFPYLQSFTETTEGNLISVGGKGIYIFDGNQWELIIESPEWEIDPSLPPKVFESLYISDLAVSADGDIWVSGMFFVDPYPGLGLFRYDGENWHHYTFEDWIGDLLTLDQKFIETGVLPSDDITSIAIGPDGALWFGTYDSGVVRFDGETWVTLNGSEYFAGDKIRDITTGPDGALWFATENGFSHFDGYEWTVYNIPGSSETKTFRQTTIAVDSQGMVWYVSPAYGLAKFDGNTISFYSDFETLASGKLIIDKQGTVWLVSFYDYDGLYMINFQE